MTIIPRNKERETERQRDLENDAAFFICVSGGVYDMASGPNKYDDDDIAGKKRKHYLTTVKTEWESPSLFQHTFRNVSSDGKISLQILKQPERQHRARYQTEGSRGAIKDRSQNMFPTVQLKGYGNKCATLQVFIGNDQGDPIPHIYYQACKVAGKNSTPCQELKKEGTDVILIDMDPSKFHEVVCDCVGILKERHSDIESKMPKQTRRTNWRKKTTKCRIVFRTEIENCEGDMEVLQAVSDSISCTQLPGTPEITKMSLSSCSPLGGEELWMIGKNFLKDCVVVFQESSMSRRLPNKVWMKAVEPLKDYFNSTHLIVAIPPFIDTKIKENVSVNVTVKCGGKESDHMSLVYASTAGAKSGDIVRHQLNGSQVDHSPAHSLSLGSTRELQNKSSKNFKQRITILEQLDTGRRARVSKRSKDKLRSSLPRKIEQPDIYPDETVFDSIHHSTEQGLLKKQQQQQQPDNGDNNKVFSSMRTSFQTKEDNSYRGYVAEDSVSSLISRDETNHTSDTNMSQLSSSNTNDTVVSTPDKSGFKKAPLSFLGVMSSLQPQALNPPKRPQQNGELGQQQQQATGFVSAFSFPNNATQQNMQTEVGNEPKPSEPVQKDKETPKEVCKYSIDSSESEVPSISIKLPPSILSNQDRLETIVNTINKAITTPTPTPAPPIKTPQQAADMLASIKINSNNASAYNEVNSEPVKDQSFEAKPPEPAATNWLDSSSDGVEVAKKIRVSSEAPEPDYHAEAAAAKWREEKAINAVAVAAAAVAAASARNTLNTAAISAAVDQIQNWSTQNQPTFTQPTQAFAGQPTPPAPLWNSEAPAASTEQQEQPQTEPQSTWNSAIVTQSFDTSATTFTEQQESPKNNAVWPSTTNSVQPAFANETAWSPTKSKKQPEAENTTTSWQPEATPHEVPNQFTAATWPPTESKEGIYCNRLRPLFSPIFNNSFSSLQFGIRKPRIPNQSFSPTVRCGI